MKGKLLLFVVLVLSLVMVSCDRFEKPTQGDVEAIDYNLIASDFFTAFSATANTTSVDNIDQFMNFFHADYLQDGKTKEDIQAIINSVFLVNEPRTISVDFVSNNELSVVWNLIISTTDDALVESMEFNDKLIKVNEEYYLYGNQVEAVNEEKLMPFAEIMTATWCGTCPQVEAAMHEYHESNPNNFFYLEFHTQDAIAGEHEFFDNFYALTSAPGTVIQGKDIFSGDASETYPSLLDSYKDMDAQLKLSNLLQSTSAENYQAQVDIENLTSAEFDTTNLKLRWAFYEDVSATNNYIGVPCRHVVLTEGFYDISSSDIDTTFNISIDYPREIPEDMGIVFWLQTASDAYDENSFVHGWIKHDLGSK
jgi:thiol-disulfide isomerase/thioredoxin